MGDRLGTDEEERLIEKLRKVEALFAGSSFAGERVAAQNARDRIRERLRLVERAEAAVEYRFSMADPWSRSLFIALLRRYDLKPYRYRGQRRTTVLAKVAPSFVNDVLWPEFQQLSATLREHLDAVTQRIIQQAIHRGDADAEEKPEAAPRGKQGTLSFE